MEELFDERHHRVRIVQDASPRRRREVGGNRSRRRVLEDERRRERRITELMQPRRKAHCLLRLDACLHERCVGVDGAPGRRKAGVSGSVEHSWYCEGVVHVLPREGATTVHQS